jgi:hypothetical protein
MARLITLLPCEKVIVDRQGMPSLISLFENLNVTPSEGEGIAEVPKQTITFTHWAVFAEWEITEEEVALREAQQVLELLYPDGSAVPIRGTIPFIFQSAGIARNHQDIYGFPVGQEGPYTIRVWLEKDGKPISEVGTRKMRVIHRIPPGAKTHPTMGHSSIP